jgi:hypothetical protein
MINSTIRKAAKPHSCEGCTTHIPAGELYLVSSMSPDHDGLGFDCWVRGHWCGTCARQYGHGDALDARAGRC